MDHGLPITDIVPEFLIAVTILFEIGYFGFYYNV